MKEQCPWEFRILRAASHRLPAELAAHVCGCEACQGSLSLAITLRQWAADDISSRTPGVRFLWLAAEERKMAQCAARMEIAMACAAVIVVVIAGTAAWKWHLLVPGASTGGIAAALVIAALVVNWFASDSTSLVYQ